MAGRLVRRRGYSSDSQLIEAAALRLVVRGNSSPTLWLALWLALWLEL